jgi:methionyl-tRNA synthetase
MSKMGQYFLEMQTDAQEMTLKEFCEKYGKSYEDVWKNINSGYPDFVDQSPV